MLYAARRRVGHPILFGRGQISRYLPARSTCRWDVLANWFSKVIDCRGDWFLIGICSYPRCSFWKFHYVAAGFPCAKCATGVATMQGTRRARFISRTSPLVRSAQTGFAPCCSYCHQLSFDSHCPDETLANRSRLHSGPGPLAFYMRLPGDNRVDHGPSTE